MSTWIDAYLYIMDRCSYVQEYRIDWCSSAYLLPLDFTKRVTKVTAVVKFYLLFSYLRSPFLPISLTFCLSVCFSVHPFFCLFCSSYTSSPLRVLQLTLSLSVYLSVWFIRCWSLYLSLFHLCVVVVSVGQFSLRPSQFCILPVTIRVLLIGSNEERGVEGAEETGETDREGQREKGQRRRSFMSLTWSSFWTWNSFEIAPLSSFLSLSHRLLRLFLSLPPFALSLRDSPGDQADLWPMARRGGGGGDYSPVLRIDERREY